MTVTSNQIFLSNLRRSADIGADAIAELEAHLSQPRTVDSHRLICESAAPTRALHVLLEGWAACEVMLPSGARQFTSFHLPGDVLNLGVLALNASGCNGRALTRCTVSSINVASLRGLLDRVPSLNAAFMRMIAFEKRVAKEWLINLGRRNARERLANLLCELYLRAQQAGLSEGPQTVLPIAQYELADALGLTSVHVNRMLQSLRSDGLLTLERGRMKVLDWEGLCQAGQFRSDYLKLLA